MSPVDDKIAGLVGERDAAWRENERLRQLYENVTHNQEQFGFTINHLLECEDAYNTVSEILHKTEEELLLANSEIVQLRRVIEGVSSKTALDVVADKMRAEDVAEVLRFQVRQWRRAYQIYCEDNNARSLATMFDQTRNV